MSTLLAQYNNVQPAKNAPTPVNTIETQYPQNLLEYEDYLKIETYKYVTLTEYFASTGLTNFIISPANTQIAEIFGVDNGGNGISAQRFIQGSIIDRIRLPVPDTIQFDDNVQWNVEDLKTIGRFAPSLAKSFAAGGNQQNTAEILQSMAKAVIPEAILGIIESTGFLSSGQAVTQGFNGKILNPYHEQIFKGLEPRTFSCRYKLVPRNLKEQISIKNIIKRLRINALPNYSKQATVSANQSTPANINVFSGLGDRWLTTPNIFNLKFFANGGDMSYLPKLKPCVLTTINANYTPDGVWSTHIDPDGEPAPTAIELQLVFHEVEIITAAEVERGF